MFCLAPRGLTSDFSGLRDVSKFAARRNGAAPTQGSQGCLEEGRAEEQRESGSWLGWLCLEAGIADPNQRAANLAQLKDRLTDLSRQAGASQDSSERRMARRMPARALVAQWRAPKTPEYRKVARQVPSDGRDPMKPGSDVPSPPGPSQRLGMIVVGGGATGDRYGN